ncbi:Prolyl-tRNA synthetase [Spironucleus salmonicida]|uniref:Prolyl-tRNA synthetase n=1 Tax=Spironucleus salmonicida TaxID=348837 RepID=V6LRV6_9EUKA|nr:Prolyl-tRNA synthetase [Spironucleus salmonicida]|eukprot:EST43514.1 YbaK/prolyl-tRNA synthetases associated domain containing protein [Spironucleus salmonicida]
MNIEKLILKPQLDQPSYIKNEHLRRLQSSGILRHDRSSNKLILSQSVFDFAEKIESLVSNHFENTQKALIQYQVESDCIPHIEFLRTTKALPISLNFGIKQSETAKNPILPSKTDFYLEFLIAQETEFSLSQFTSLAQLFSLKDTFVNTTQFGFVLSTSSQTYEVPTYEEVGSLNYEEELLVHTPNSHTVGELSTFLKIDPKLIIKAVLFEFQSKLVFVYIRGDLDVNQAKLEQFLGGKVQLATQKLLEFHDLIPGFAGIKGMKNQNQSQIVLDLSCKTMNNCVTGANKLDVHIVNFDFKKYIKSCIYVDLVERSCTKTDEILEFKRISRDFKMLKQSCSAGLLRVHLLDVLALSERIRDDDFYAVQGVDFRPESGVYDARQKVSVREKLQLATLGGFRRFLVVGKAWLESGKMEEIDLAQERQNEEKALNDTKM